VPERIECAGAYAVFDGINSPVTQTLGLAIFEELSAAWLDVIERFFFDCGAQVLHEVSPLAREQSVLSRRVCRPTWRCRRALDP